MSWTVTPQLKTLAGTAGAIPQASILGLPIDGGFFGGYISHTADGSPTHALIVAPKTGGDQANLKWADETVAVPASATVVGANSTFDGQFNTDLMMSLIANGTYSADAFPAAQFCADLSLGGFTDWYFPARFELDIAYFNLKPSTANNVTTVGVNDYSVPKRTANYTLTYPSQTYVTAFNTTAEAFLAVNYRSSTENSATNASRVSFASGAVGGNKTSADRVRAFRRIAL
jgi:hypothetical protein